MGYPVVGKKIWLIGGTQESAELARVLLQFGFSCVVSVTTASARSLYPTAPELQIWVGRLDVQGLPAFLQAHPVAAILDASHPFAVEISQLAIAMAAQTGIPYLRYERPLLPAGCHASTTVYLDSFERLFTEKLLSQQRVLLTVGYRPLALFKPWQTQAVLFARILPSVPALEAALEAGFTPDRLIALRPPISAELERSLWQQWQLSMVVTKASGSAGGEDVKQQVAAELGIQLIVVDRPPVAYPQQTSDLAIALDFCRQHLSPALQLDESD